MSAKQGPQQRLDAQQMRQLAAAESALRAGNLPLAAEKAEELTAHAPHAADAWHIWALALAQVGNPGAACARFQRALELTPENPALLANYATALRRADQPAEAVELWRRAVAIAPQFGQAWLDLGLGELDLDHPGPACKALQRAVQLMPASAVAWHGLGSALAARGKTGEAEQAFRKALECDPGQASVWINLGQMYRRQARVDAALECYAKARQADGEAPELLDAQAGALLDLGRVEEAIATARRMTTAFPHFAPGQRTLAQLLLEHAPDEAHGGDPLSVFAEAVDSHAGDTSLRLAYASLLRQAGRAEAALEQIAILRAQGDHPVLQRAQADTLEVLDRSAEAAPLYAGLYRYARLRAPDLLNAFTRHCLKTGDWPRAEALAAESLARNPDNQEAWAYRATAWRLLGDEREYWLCDYQRLVDMLDIQTPAGYPDTDRFLESLREALLSLHQASGQPVQQSLRHGTQTAGSLFGRKDPAIAAVEEAIRQAALRWTDTLPDDPGHPFLRRKSKHIRFSGSWSVKLSSTGHHANHIHQEGWISSAFYVALPETMHGADDAAGWIQFGQPPLDLGLDLEARRALRPRPGYLALFPSYMWHGTMPFQDDSPRLTVACDMIGD